MTIVLSKNLEPNHISPPSFSYIKVRNGSSDMGTRKVRMQLWAAQMKVKSIDHIARADAQNVG